MPQAKKKKWITPEFYILSTNDINGGGQPSFHEKTLESIFTTGGGLKIGHVKSGPMASGGGIWQNAIS